jgi:VWFA-related protein
MRSRGQRTLTMKNRSVASLCFRVLRGRAFVALSALALTAQAPPPPPQPPIFRTEANYVRVDAYPTRDDAPVTDLTQDDFEILENNVSQKIEQFEHVVIRGNLPQEMRREPNSVEESRQAAQNPRARVIAVFLDVGHVEIGGSHNIRQPLIDTLNRVIGEEDLVGVMTPEMSARDVTFARRTTTIEGFLTRHWPWGERDALNLKDPVEQEYEICYGQRTRSALTEEMIERRREKQTLDALEDLVVFLRGAREERKAILAITAGWRLFRPNAGLADAGRADVPPIGTISGTGRLGVGYGDGNTRTALADCERDRMNLAHLDNEQTFRRLLDEANRANASFYPLDPRGLVVFDAPIGGPGSAPTRSLVADAAIVTGRLNTLRTIADATDGLALVNSNDLSSSLKKLAADLSSYYLLGYYSSGKLDGKFHPINVRVKRPGVRVRARRGYLAATPAEAATAASLSTKTGGAASSPAGSAAADAELAAATAAVASLAPYARDVPLRVQVAGGWKAGAPASAAIWVVGEVGGPDLDAQWRSGGSADVELIASSGGQAAAAHAIIPAGARAFRVALAPADLVGGEEFVVRVSARAGAGAVRESARVTLPRAPDSVGAVWFRRGPSTANRDVPTADLRYRRTEQLRVEMLAASASEEAAARLLDRTGKPLAVPVSAATRADADGVRWRTGQVALAALAPGDYIVEISEGSRRMFAAFRVVP